MRRDLFDDVHDQFRDSFRSFVTKEMVPHYLEWEAAGIAPRELFAAAGASGFTGMAVPEEHGGGGVEDFRFNAILAEELARAGIGGAGLGITLHNDITTPYFLAYCNDEQRRRWLPGIASGELITAIAMTEPGIGSDLASMSTKAIRDGDHYVVNGAKTFITNGINADLVVTAVKTDPSARHAGMSIIVIERGMDGFERGRNLEKVGLHSQDTAELFFNDVHVPVANLLGEEGQGFRYLVSNLPAGAPVDRRGRRGDRPRRPRLGARVREGAHRLRPADRLVPEHAASCSPRWRPRSRWRRPSSTSASSP